MNSKLTVLLILALAVAMASSAPKPRTMMASPIAAAAVTYTAPGGIAYHAPAAFVYPVFDANSKVLKDQDCPGCPELGEGFPASFVTATPTYYI